MVNTTYRLFVYFRVTALAGGNLEPVKVPESLYKNALDDSAKMQQLVGNAAWCLLHQAMGEGAEHQHMLRNLIHKLGKDTVYRKFVEGIIFEELQV